MWEMGLTKDGMCGGWYDREAGGWAWMAYKLALGGSCRQEIALDDEN